jgi:hypothetical protein
MLRRPPAWARWLLECALPRDVREDVSGDLEELYHARVAALGLQPARFWFGAQAIVFALRFLAERVRDRVLSVELVPHVDRPVVPSSGTRDHGVLFAHLFASQRVRERRVFWIVGALLNLPVALLIFHNTVAERETSLVDLSSPGVADDHSVLLDAAVADPASAKTREDGGPHELSGRRDVPVAVTGSRAVGAVSGPADALQAPVASSLPAANSTSAASLHDRLLAPSSATALLPRRIHVESMIPANAGPNPDQRLAQFNDSLRAAQAAAAEAEDWTVEHALGRRSGMTPGALHGLGRELRVVLTLGDSTADVFQPSAGRRGEVAARVQLWHEIQLHARRAEIRAIFNERVRLIRERKNNARVGSESGAAISRTVIALYE